MSNLNNQTNLTISDYKSLLRGANLYGSGDANVTGISRDTRHVEAGDLFICIRGEKHDSHRYAAQALSRGAVALVIDANELEAVRQNSEIPADTPILAVKNTRWALPLIACAFYGNPSQSMKIIGITGTNGKTTSTMMVAAILRAAGMRVGTIGTLGADLDGVPIQSDHTTPEFTPNIVARHCMDVTGGNLRAINSKICSVSPSLGERPRASNNSSTLVNRKRGDSRSCCGSLI